MKLQLDEIRATFHQECTELLAELEHQLSVLRNDGANEEALNSAFRAVHSIKGGAGIFSLSRIVSFAHAFETVLDLMRRGTIQATAAVMDSTLRAFDVMADLIHAAQSGTELPAGHEVDAMRQLMATAGVDPNGVSDVQSTASPAPAEPAAEGFGSLYRVVFKPHPQMLRRLNDPLLIIRQLETLGSLKVSADLSALPSFADLQPTDAYISWVLELETQSPRSAIEEAFDFVEGDCDLAITPLKIITEQPAGSGNDAKPKPVAGKRDQFARPALSTRIGPAVSARGTSSVRVDLDRIDRLFDMVGEIAVARAMVAQRSDHALMISHPELSQGLAQLLQLTADLHDTVLAIRAQPVRSVFARMPRLVRDLCAETGKDVRLEVSGEATEIDKTVIEELSDPLTHMIRNAVDHGIESAAERMAANKTSHGTVRLSAEQRGNRIVIKVADDGRGIDRKKTKSKAIEKGLIPADAALSDEEIDHLIFLPGFSTAKQVSGISGRGVGMDVVKRNVQKLGGRVTVRSEPGRGTRVILTLPLTLAILPGMVVRVGPVSYVVPIANIVECLAARDGQIQNVPGSGEVLRLRGQYIPLVRMDALLSTSQGPNEMGPIVVVEADDRRRVGLAVDEIIGQQQVVIKSLRENVGEVAGIAGATILGDGAVALILDVAALSELCAMRASAHPHAHQHKSDGRTRVA